MREVRAIIRPQRLEHVMEALHEIPGLPGVTVSKVHAYAGFRRRDDQLPPEADLTKLEIIVPSDLVENVVSAIGRASHTGRAGDGIVVVVPVERFVRVRDYGNEGTGGAGG